ncbi:MAG TPA: IS200/IS605 family transposase [Cyclobacteriaceae bacterium]|nr:IS200/IS605 family transposase [Cyclobacteriaceae bacterium]
MGSYTQILYQIVFSTKYRARVLVNPNRQELFNYIAGILKEKNCHAYQINGVEDHLHILIRLHPSVTLSGLVKDIKLATNKFIKEKRLFPLFNGWQVGYGAFTYSVERRKTLIEYIKRQEEHHRVQTFPEEYRKLLDDQEVEYDEKYIFE